MDEKFATVMKGSRKRRCVAEICHENQISQTLYDRWRNQFLDPGKGALVDGGSDDKVYKAQIEKLQTIIGKQAIRIEIVKLPAAGRGGFY